MARHDSTGLGTRSTTTLAANSRSSIYTTRNISTTAVVGRHRSTRRSLPSVALPLPVPVVVTPYPPTGPSSASTVPSTTVVTLRREPVIPQPAVELRPPSDPTIVRLPTSSIASSSRHKTTEHGHDPPTKPDPTLPDLPHTAPYTRYMAMLLSQDTIPRLHNILGSFFTWLLLAGFVVFPGTFTSIQQGLGTDPNVEDNQTASAILHSVRNVPLLVVAIICCMFSSIGTSCLAVRWRHNYVWLLNTLYIPGVMNGFAGLISTLISVYAQQQGDWSISARITATFEGISIGVCGLLALVYRYWLLRRIKKAHDREMRLRELRIPIEGVEAEKTGGRRQEQVYELGTVV